MTDSSFTLLEVHLGDGDIEIGPFELFGAADEPAASVDAGAEAEVDAVDGPDDAGSGGCPARSIAGLLLAIAALAAIAVGVVALRGDDETPSGVADDD